MTGTRLQDGLNAEQEWLENRNWSDGRNMRTDEIRIDNHGAGLEEALEEMERFSEYQRLSPRETLRIRLLAEEAIGMIRSLTMDFEGTFFAEGKKKGDRKDCSIHIIGEAVISGQNREELLAMSRSGKNILAQGIMGKIRSIFDTSLAEGGYIPQNDMLEYGICPGYMFFGGDSSYAGSVWSLKQYKDRVEEDYLNPEKDEGEEAWDELQKSIVANLADDIQIGVLQEKVQMIIYKKF